MIGIIGAMDVEVAKLKEMLGDTVSYEKAGMTFIEGTCCGKKVVVVRSGIGKVNAAICAQILVDKFNVDYIINTGIAGSLRAEINIGDIVLSKDTLHHDMDATGFGYGLGVIPQMKESIFKGDEKLIELAKKCQESKIPQISTHIGRVVSGDQFISDKEQLAKIKANFPDAMAVDMESASIAHVCYMYNVPFMSFRIMSDTPGANEDNFNQYMNFWKSIADNSFAVCKAFLLQLDKSL